MYFPTFVLFFFLSVAHSEFLSTTRQFPFAVSVGSKTEGHLCVGAVFSALWVLSPASCFVVVTADNIASFRPAENLIVASKTVLKTDTNRGFEVASLRVHPMFTISSLQSNLALLELNRKLYWFWQGLILPKVAPFVLGLVEKSAEFYAVGWATSAEEDDSYLSYHEFQSSSAPDCNTVDYVCAVAKAPNEFCFLDEGSLLVDEEEYTLVGILARAGIPNGCSAEVEKFTRLEPYVLWIENETKIKVKTRKLAQAKK